VDTIQQMVESHIAACVLTDKGENVENNEQVDELNLNE